MNKLSVGLLLAASLFILDVSPAAAHPGVDSTRGYRDAHHVEVARHNGMPKWLKRNKRFRHWYRQSPLKRYRRISWNQLYEIYRWERNYFIARRHPDFYGSAHRVDDRRQRHRRDH